VRLRGRDSLIAAAPLVLAALAVVVLLRFPPDAYGFYPVCPVFRYLHVLCPGCGATRALAALLRGQLSLALQLNLLVVALLPMCSGYAAVAYRRWLGREEFAWPRIPAAAVYGLLTVTAIFGVARNL
jgi:Protein of unknown function (DUF2752)